MSNNVHFLGLYTQLIRTPLLGFRAWKSNYILYIFVDVTSYQCNLSADLPNNICL